MSISFEPGEPVTHTKLNSISIRRASNIQDVLDGEDNIIYYIKDHHNFGIKKDSIIYLFNTNDTGSIEIFAGIDDKIPGGWLLCDGRELNRVDYKGLFDIIGTNYGEGDGSETFNIPDMVEDGKFAYQSEGTYVGENEVTLSVDNLPSHSHSNPSPTPYQNTLSTNNPGGGGGNSEYVSSSRGGSQPHENRPPFIRMRYIIKV